MTLPLLFLQFPTRGSVDNVLKKRQSIENQLSFVVQPGLEPRLADPESDVLPLHHWTGFFLSKSGAKVRFFFIPTKFF